MARSKESVPRSEVSAALREFVVKHGVATSCRHFGLTISTLGRCAAGLGIQPASLRVIELGLKSEPAPEPAPDRVR